MTTPRVLGAKFSAMFRKQALDQRIGDEVDQHLEMLAEEHERRGMPAREAHYAALREFGGVEQMKESWRDARGLPWLESIAKDLAFALRMMRRNPGVSRLVISVLALGIGVAVTVASVLGTMFLRPLAYPDAARLVLAGEAPRDSSPAAPVPPAGRSLLDAWREQAKSVEAVGAYLPVAFVVNPAQDAVRVPGEYVTEGYFETLGMRALMGRTLGPGDFAPSAQPAVVLGYRCWREVFGGDPKALGRSVRVDGRMATVVGVMPAGFRSSALEGGARLWAPLVASATEGSEPGVFVVARLRAGASLDNARVELATLAARLAPKPRSQAALRVRVENMQEHYSNGARSPLAGLLTIAVGCVFLVACANAANLLLARGIERRREITVRLAMGAGRWRVLRQLVLENGAMALGGAAAGVLLAVAAIPVLSHFAQPLFANTGLERFEIDGRALALAMALAVLATLAAGVVPALAGSRLDINQSLKEAGGTTSAGRKRRRLVSLLVAAQVALSVVLLCETVLVVQAIASMARFDWGFPVENRLAMGVRLNQREMNDVRRQAFFSSLRDRVAAVPGVRSAALASGLPIQLAMGTQPVRAEGNAAGGGTAAVLRVVSGEYADALGIPLLRGRTFDDSDRAGGEPVALINDDLARALWPAQDPLGARVEASGVWRTIVGVTATVAAHGMLRRGGPEVLIPYSQEAPTALDLIIRTTADPGAVLPALRAAVREMDADQPVGEMQTLAQWHRQLCQPLDFVILLLGGFAFTAVVLAAVGVYAVMAHSVNSRARDLGIRKALGASTRNIIREVLGGGMRLVAWGALTGCVLGVALARVMASRLWWLHASPATLLPPVAALIALVAAAACWLPAARAAAIDPAPTLRSE